MRGIKYEPFESVLFVLLFFVVGFSERLMVSGSLEWDTFIFVRV